MAKRRKNRIRNTRNQRSRIARRSLRFPIKLKPIPRATTRVRGNKTPTFVSRTTRKRTLETVTRATARKNNYSVLTPTRNSNKLNLKVCKRRHQRKEIIHAVGKSGQSGQKRPDQRTREIKCQ